MVRSRSFHALRRLVLAAVPLCLLTAIGTAHAQTRWTVDPKTSLAWWQMSPNLNHLWGTTCPQEPTWRPGDGRSPGWNINPNLRPPKLGDAGVEDTVHVPLYPRRKVRPLCAEAVQGQISVADTAQWQGVRGEVVVKSDALISGNEKRDLFTRQAVLQSNRYPEIRFTIDSVVGVTRQGNILRGTAVGAFSLHGVVKPMTAVIRALSDTSGDMRVHAKFRIPVYELVPDYGLSKAALGLGVGTGVWKDLFLGVDLVLHPEEASDQSQH